MLDTIFHHREHDSAHDRDPDAADCLSQKLLLLLILVPSTSRRQKDTALITARNANAPSSSTRAIFWIKNCVAHVTGLSMANKKQDTTLFSSFQILTLTIRRTMTVIMYPLRPLCSLDLYRCPPILFVCVLLWGPCLLLSCLSAVLFSCSSSARYLRILIVRFHLMCCSSTWGHSGLLLLVLVPSPFYQFTLFFYVGSIFLDPFWIARMSFLIVGAIPSSHISPNRKLPSHLMTPSLWSESTRSFHGRKPKFISAGSRFSDTPVWSILWHVVVCLHILGHGYTYMHLYTGTLWRVLLYQPLFLSSWDHLSVRWHPYFILSLLLLADIP